MKTQQRGFTLLELLVVMFIIGIAAAFIAPSFQSGKTVFLEAQMREVVAVLNYARRSAIVEGRAKMAVFSQGQEDAQPDEKPAKNSPFSKELVAWTSRGAKLEWKADNTGRIETPENSKKDHPDKPKQHKIIFYPEGGSTGGTLILSQYDNKVMIVVHPITGKIRSYFEGEDEEE